MFFKQSFSCLLPVLATLVGSVAGQAYHIPDNMVEERIVNPDGTVSQFLIHPSFVTSNESMGAWNKTDFGHLEDLRLEVRAGNLSAMLETMDRLHVRGPTIRDLPVLNNSLSATATSNNSITDDYWSRSFHSKPEGNYTFCGWSIPLPSLGKEEFLNRPTSRDCARLWEMWLHRWGYFQLEPPWGTSANPQDWNLLSQYDSCQLYIRRIDLDEYGARIGNGDLLWWVAAGIVIALGSQWENPTSVIWMAPVSGTLGCQDLGPNDWGILELQLIRNANSPAPSSSASTDMTKATDMPPSILSQLVHPTPSNGVCVGIGCINGT